MGYERREITVKEKRSEEKKKFSLDPKTNNDSSYNRNKPSQLCQTQALHLKRRTEKKARNFPSIND